MPKRLLAYSALFLAIFLLAVNPALAPDDGALTGVPPFIFGEHLVYKIEWDPPWYMFFLPTIEAGEAELLLTRDSEYNQKKALKLTLKGRSSGMLAKIMGMKVEDEFVFYTEPDTLCTLASAQKVREGKRKRQINVEYLRETRQLHIREIDEAVTPPKLRKNAMKDNIPACLHDPLSALYLFRLSRISLNQSQVYVIGNDDKIQEVKTFVEQKEKINTSFGKIYAWRVQTTALKEELFRARGQFKIWISADEKRLPLQFEAKVPLGRVIGKLKSSK